ncbi:hypothetical protein OEZ85_012511 [Tetradesmus obliquus]|uniref:Uncharacterized protein n=1 Tax=Tetradesmus obliquus TaxID=3088 RepID=A0ABY8TTN3_TETOB|nr:hypothetical protein OEZ85_012511 [Tetradesmus obliquus]
MQRTHDPAALGRGYAVLIQADFQLERLTDLHGTLQQCGHQIQQLPLTAIMLWGVVAVEFQEAEAARSTLGAYLEATQGRPEGMSREDAMALSRLYAVQLLAGLCQDFMAAAAWLEAGGAGLSHEQQELLLLEVDEAEELLQEEHLAAWASTHAAAATDGGAADPAAGSDAHQAARADSELYRDADADAHSNAPCGTAMCSTAASLSIADSAGGMLGFQSPPYADLQINNGDDGSGSNNSSNGALQGAGGVTAAVNTGYQQQHEQQQSLMEWISSSGSKLWATPAVQGVLHALHLQELQPYEVVGGAALAGLVGWSVYRERRAMKRAVADLAAGVAQTARVALGFTVVNPMGAVPGTQHMLR